MDTPFTCRHECKLMASSHTSVFWFKTLSLWLHDTRAELSIRQFDKGLLIHFEHFGKKSTDGNPRDTNRDFPALDGVPRLRAGAQAAPERRRSLLVTAGLSVVGTDDQRLHPPCESSIRGSALVCEKDVFLSQCCITDYPDMWTVLRSPDTGLRGTDLAAVTWTYSRQLGN